ncbi:36188_t:CDS:1, partial [Gigaspora margarita]
VKFVRKIKIIDTNLQTNLRDHTMKDKFTNEAYVIKDKYNDLK